MRRQTWSSVTLLGLALVALAIPASADSQPVVAGGKQSDELRRLCAKIREIKKLPFRRDEVSVEVFKQLDPVYGEFRRLGDAMIPCLIDKVTDEAAMDDPSQAPHAGPVAVGDVAFWVFLDITGMPMEEALPPAVQKDYKERGRYAYLDWIRNSPANRKTLQKNIRRWYAQRPKDSAGKGAASSAPTDGLHDLLTS